jgi:hypothetical protein
MYKIKVDVAPGALKSPGDSKKGHASPLFDLQFKEVAIVVAADILFSVYAFRGFPRHEDLVARWTGSDICWRSGK